MISFVRLDVENYMGIRAVSISPRGNLIQITGKNGAGKSAVINAFYAALFGKKAIAADPVHHGATEARIRLDLGEVIIRLKIEPDGDSSLIVESEKGARFPSPQTMLKKLLDFAAFDPSEFLRMSEKQQFDELAKIVGLSDMLREMAAAHQVDFENRTVHNRKAKELQARVEAIQWDGKPVESVDVASVMAEIKSAEAHNATVTDAVNRQGALIQRAADAIRAAEQKEAEAERLINEADALRAKAAEAREEKDRIVIDTRIDTAPLQQRILDAQSINEQARKIQQRATLAEEMHAEQDKADALTKRINERAAEKASVIAACEMPVPGLGFDDNGITLHGVPFNQASTAQRGKVAVAIGMYAKPELRLMVIRDASLFDDDTMADIEQMAVAEDYIVLAERVRDDDTVGIVISAGEVVKDNYAAAA